MGLEIEEGDSIVNMTIPTGTTFPDIGSPGELVNIENSINAIDFPDGMYMYTKDAWKRFIFTGEDVVLPTLTVTRSFGSTSTSAAPQVVTWDAVSNTDAATFEIQGSSGLGIRLPGKYKVTYNLAVTTNAPTGDTIISTAIVGNDSIIESTRTSVTLNSATLKSTIMSGELIITLISPVVYTLYIEQRGGTTRSFTFGPAGNFIIKKISE